VGNIIADGTAAGGVAPVEYALCSLEQVKVEIGLTDTAEDDRLARAINDASDRLETIFNRRIIKRLAPVVEYHDDDEDDEHDNDCIWTREYPVESMSDVVSIKVGLLGVRADLDLAKVILDRQRVLVFPYGGPICGPQSNEITYRPGYSVCPHDLQGVAINLAQKLYWQSKRIQAGDTEESAGGTTRKKDPLAFSAEDQLIVDAYKRKESGAWPRRMEWLR
jgi:hypothetical protein